MTTPVPYRAQRKRWALYFFVGLCALNAGCADINPLESPRGLASRVAAENSFTPLAVAADPFILSAYYKGRAGQSDTVTVYLEGDGHAWASRYQVSADPTPHDPRALRMAVQDPAPNVVYLARPCQYANEATMAGCHVRYWTGARLAPEVVTATSAAIDHFKAVLAANRVRLVGYSGGGGLAVLVAAMRNDVDGLLTVAGNLDHVAWTRHHEITAMTASLNPADHAARIADVAQLHMIGGDDDVMPALVARAYAGRLPDGSRARFVELPDFDHDCCWVRDWTRLLRQYPISGEPVVAID